ncbi:MULE transposase domain protein [Fusarium beomiforme]|uniref:MULE transposase domain protein n=1 Tax=Fusarium beomiforme TaxID=44412 RepID=A0A9P5DS24_9HYPO|nr:MULE transposase domain protein [Fusarium beomiforme]
MRSKSCLLRFNTYTKEIEEMNAADAALDAALIRLRATPPPQPAPEPLPLLYLQAEAIYLQYQHDRNEWYKTLPQGVTGTDERYRRATGLPLVYEEAEYNKARGRREMGMYCIEKGRRRHWTKEEMNAWIDREKEEEQRDKQKAVEDWARDQYDPDHRVSLQRRWGEIERDLQNQ